MLWLQVRDIHAEHERLAAARVPILRRPMTEPWGLTEMWIEDPDGTRSSSSKSPAITHSAATHDPHRSPRNLGGRSICALTGCCWYRQSLPATTRFRLTLPRYSSAPGPSLSSPSSGSTPPSRCCSCVRRTSRINAVSRASSGTLEPWSGSPPEVPWGCSRSSMTRSSSRPESLAQHPAGVIVLLNGQRRPCPAEDPPLQARAARHLGQQSALRDSAGAHRRGGVEVRLVMDGAAGGHPRRCCARRRRPARRGHGAGLTSLSDRQSWHGVAEVRGVDITLSSMAHATSLGEIQHGWRTLRDARGTDGWPRHGVYFFYESGEVRADGRDRVVRVGTHALTATNAGSADAAPSSWTAP